MTRKQLDSQMEADHSEENRHVDTRVKYRNSTHIPRLAWHARSIRTEASCRYLMPVCLAGSCAVKITIQPVARFASLDEALLALGTFQTRALIGLIGGYPLIQDLSFKAS